MAQDNKIDLRTALEELDRWQQAGEQGGVQSSQRRFPRFPVRGQARLLPGTPMAASASGVHVHIRDISRSGVGVLSTEPARPGDFWQVRIEAEQVTIATLPGFCRHTRKVVEGVYLIGIEFAIEAGILLALGVAAKDLARGDEAALPPEPVDDADFVGPEDVLNEEAA